MRQGDNSALVEQIAKRLPCQAGGGIHSIERARQVLDAGAKRVIIGSALFSAEGTVNIEFAAALAGAAGRGTHRCRHRHEEWPHRREGLEGAGRAHARRRDPATRTIRRRVSLHARGWRGHDAGLSHRDRRAPAQAYQTPAHRRRRHSQPAGDGSRSMAWARMPWWAWRCTRICWLFKAGTGLVYAACGLPVLFTMEL